jgi:glycosyltransferase involved in cell wall biosynthesis
MAARVGVVCDLREERWPSMDLVADMLLENLPSESVRGEPEGEPSILAARVQPEFRWRFARSGRDGSREARAFTLDRALNRFWDYPRHLRGLRGEYDLFHVVDQAYAQLVHVLPPERTVVTCHDLHTFQCLLEPSSPRRSRAFRSMTRYVLRGLERAGRIVVDTAAVGDALVEKGVAPAERIEVVHLGVHPLFSARPAAGPDAAAARLLGDAAEGGYLLHVGGTFARKRLDVVLAIFAEARRARPGLRLVRVGGPLTPAQSVTARSLGVEGAIDSLPFIGTDVLAAVYRGAGLLILPSEEEGFGFPVLEAMACGTPVIASDLPVLREVGGNAAEFRAFGDVAAWSDAVLRLLDERDGDGEAWRGRVGKGIRHAQGFTWREYARKMVNVYQRMLNH